MATLINSNIHWRNEKVYLTNRKMVSFEEYKKYINSHNYIYEIESLHRDDTDYRTFFTEGNVSFLIGWADHYQNFYYIYS